MLPQKSVVSLPQYQWGWISLQVFQKEWNITTTLKQTVKLCDMSKLGDSHLKKIITLSFPEFFFTVCLSA